jgi:DNA polymerase
MDPRAFAERPFRRWRPQALACLAEKRPPEDLRWNAAGELEASLFDPAPRRWTGPRPSLPAPFVKRAVTGACHSCPERWEILYRLLWRLVSRRECHLLQQAGDPDLRRFETIHRAVVMDIHHMIAFLRFQQVATGDPDAVELVAHYEPDHSILGWVVPHFIRRLGSTSWAIMTPRASVVHTRGKTQFGPGATRCPSDDPDTAASLWRRYYQASFNPTRANHPLFERTLPRRYRRHLTEAPVIESLTEVVQTSRHQDSEHGRR